MRIRDIQRNDLRAFLDGPDLRHGKMLQLLWPRLTDKKVRNPVTKQMEIVEPKGTLVERRAILRSDWKQPTPSKNFVPKGGRMFNAKSDEAAQKAKAVNDLYLLLSLEGKTHPHGERDHPVNVPLRTLCQIRDTHTDICYRVLN